jgi:protein required for attachment to host cells
MGKHGETTWVLAANRSHACVYEKAGRLGHLTKLHDLENPRGRLKNSEINSDRGGRAFPRHGTGSSSMMKAHDPVEHEAEAFAGHLGELLDEACRNHRFENLVLVAEPHFLGLIRGVLEPATLHRVSASVPKGIPPEDEGELARAVPPPA